MSNIIAQDPELLHDYLTECDELLQRADQDLVALEGEAAGESYTELLNRIFRVFHTIKGTSGFMGLEQIVALTHHAEDVLNSLRKRTTPLSTVQVRQTMDVLLMAHDQVSRMVGDVRQNTPRTYVLDPLIARLP